MTDCEVCGAEGGDLIALIEGARLHVCSRCVQLGKLLYSPQPVREQRGAAGTPVSLRTEFELVEDFADKIRNARMRMKITTAVLAELVNEKESFLDRIEKGEARPEDILAHRLEKALGIKLLEAAAAGTKAAPAFSSPSSGSGGRTLGDVLEIERKKKK